MKELQIILWLLIGIAALNLQMVYFLKDNAAPDHTKQDKWYKLMWHGAGGAIHIWMGITIGILWGAEWGILMGAMTWFLFDGSVNSWYLKKEWFSIGTTAILDITQRKIAAWLRLDPRTLSGTLKCLLLAAAIMNLFIR